MKKKKKNAQKDTKNNKTPNNILKVNKNKQ